MRLHNCSRGRGLGSALLSKRYGRPTAPSRRRLPTIDGLEERLAPAVAGNLFVVGTTLVYNGNFADNNVTVSGTGGSLTIGDTAGTISSTVPGFTGGSGSVTGTIPSYIQSIAIQGQNGTDVVNVGATGLSTTRNVILAGTTVNINGVLAADNVTATGTLVSLTGTTGSISTNAGGASPIAGSVIIDGTLDVTSSVSNTLPTYTPTINTSSTIDGNITLNGLVVGNQNLILDAGSGGNVTAVQAINLGGTAGFAIVGSTTNPEAIGADTVNLHQIVDGTNGTLVNAADAVNVNGSVISTGPVIFAANLDDSGPQGFTQLTGPIITTATTGGFSAGVSSAVDIFVNAYPDPSAAVTGTGTGGETLTGITTGSGGNVFLATGNSYAANGVTPLNGGGPIQGSPLYGGTNVSAGTGGLYAVSGAGGINLTTSVASLEAGDFSDAPSNGNVNISNSGQALTLVPTLASPLALVASNGNVSLTNNLPITVDGNVLAGGQSQSVTLTTTNPTSASGTLTLGGTVVVGTSADTVNLDTTGAIVDTAGTATVTATTLNINAGSGTSGTPAGDIGSSTDPLPVSSGISGTPITVTATTTIATTSGVNIEDTTSPLTITGATAQSGVIELTTTGANDLVVNGFVANNDSSNITLSSGQNILINSGSVTSGSGVITLTPGTLTTGTAGGVTVAGNTSVATGGNIFVSSSVATGTGAVDIIDISGTLAAGGDITINGVNGAVPVTLGISGTIAADALNGVTIDTSKGTGVQVLNLGGTIAAGPNGIAIKTGGSASSGVIVTTTGTIKSAGNFTLTPLSGAPITLNLGGSITATGTLSFAAGAASPTTVVLNNSGALTGGTAVTIDDSGGTGTFLFSNTGPITGGTVTVKGTDGASNTLLLGGSLTATTGAITVTTAGDTAAGSTIVISGVTRGASPTIVKGSTTKADQFVVTPSTTTGFTFTFGSGANTLAINTPVTNISSASASFATAITFTTNVFVQWTRTGGTVTVTPTVA